MTVPNQEVIASRGINTGAKKMKGIKIIKLRFTAAGFPVLSAIAYGKPANANPQNPEIITNTIMPSAPVSNRTPTKVANISTGMVKATTKTRSATIKPSNKDHLVTGGMPKRLKYPP